MIDTSVAIDLESCDQRQLPDEIAVSTLTLAELGLGIASAASRLTVARRRHLRQIEARAETLDFDRSCAAAYEHVCRATFRAGRRVRGRSVDLMIAGTALAHELPLYTHNVVDLRGLEGLIEIVDLS